MSKSRLSELRGENLGVELEEYSDDDPGMGEFYREVGRIKDLLGTFKRNVQGIKECYNEQVWSSTNMGSNNGDRLEELLHETNAYCNDLRTRLKRMANDNRQAEQALMSNDANNRIRKNMHSSLTKKFMDLVEEYQTLQTTYKDKYRDRVHRQARIVNPDIQDYEVDEMLESGTPQQLFANRVVDDRKYNEAKNALIFIQEQHRDIMQLEKSIVELHQLFMDMQNLVNMQGEMVNVIEHNVKEAADFSGQGLKMLETAEHTVVVRRKKCCICCCILCCCLLVLIALILLGVGIGVGVYFIYYGG